MKPPIKYAYGPYSEKRNERYWDKLYNPIWTSAELILNGLDTLSKLTAFMETITYTPDSVFPWKWAQSLRFATGHWWQWPVTTIHRMKGDCEDMARMWYDRLTAMDYDATVYILFRKFWGVELPWHFVCAWRERISIPLANIEQDKWCVASNNEISMMPPAKTENGVVKGYCRWYNYSSAKPLSHKDITGDKS